MEDKIYDTIIAGGGPAGYSAALYCARANLKTLILEKLYPGGQMATTAVIDNYPGFDTGIDGVELADRMKAGAERFGAESLFAEVTGTELGSKEKTIHTSDGDFRAKTVIIATGANPRKLGLPEEDQLAGKGISYCATCDGMFYKDKTVVISGGGDTAAADALVLSKTSKQVYMVHRRDALRASASYTGPLEKASNIKIIWNSRISSVMHEETVTGVKLENLKNGSLSELACDGVFVAIGRIPNTELFRGIIDIDKAGYIMADETTKTNLQGVFAAGDVRTKPLRQVVTAASDGAVAAKSAEEYITQNF